MTTQDSLLIRKSLLAAGHTPSAIQYRVESGSWSRVFNGMYLPTSTSETLENTASWHQAVLQRGGPQSVLSHETAAIRHGFDSTKGWDATSIAVTVPNSTRSFRAQTSAFQPLLRVIRTRHLPDPNTVLHDADGRRFTDRARTLVDVAAGMSDREFSLVLESGLRGANPKRPDQWREDVMAELVDMVNQWRRKPGVSTVRRALARRIPGRPTGSIADSTVLFALLAAGITDVIVQPCVTSLDRHGHIRLHFADLMIPSAQLIIEIDGSMHDLPDRRKLDHERDRRLSPGFHVFRYPATVALFEPGHIVADVKAHLRRSPDLGNSWEVSGRHVEGAAHRWSIVPTVTSA